MDSLPLVITVTLALFLGTITFLIVMYVSSLIRDTKTLAKLIEVSNPEKAARLYFAFLICQLIALTVGHALNMSLDMISSVVHATAIAPMLTQELSETGTYSDMWLRTITSTFDRAALGIFSRAGVAIGYYLAFGLVAYKAIQITKAYLSRIDALRPQATEDSF